MKFAIKFLVFLDALQNISPEQSLIMIFTMFKAAHFYFSNELKVWFF